MCATARPCPRRRKRRLGLGACLWLALGIQFQAFPDERKNLAGARGAAAPRSALPPPPANRYCGLGWALRAGDGARADELSKDYRALRT